MKTCFECKSEVDSQALKCKFCGTDLTTLANVGKLFGAISSLCFSLFFLGIILFFLIPILGAIF